MIEVKGNGKIVSREISVSTFIRLHVACTGTIELHQGEEEKVSIEADENLLDYFSAVNAGRTLYVSVEGKLRQPVFTSCTVKVYLRQLDTLYVRNDRGNVICPRQLTFSDALDIKIQSAGNTEIDLSAPAVKILCQANGNTTLRGKCGKLIIKNQSNGHFDSSQLTAAELVITNMANGNVLLHATDSISIAHYGNGYIHYSGPAKVKDVKQYGHGAIKHLSEGSAVGL